MKRYAVILMIVTFLLSACTPLGSEPTPTTVGAEELESPPLPTMTATSEPPQMLTVCTTGLPAGLFPYDGFNTPVKENLLALIYEDAFIRVGGELVPNIVERVPNQADGDLRLEPVSVQRGQPIVDARGELVVLKPGVRIRPSGCRQNECAILWDGEMPLEMDQMVIEYRLMQGLTWSDGTDMTASDSVFSFQLANAPEAPGLKWAEDRTQSYLASDTSTLRWVGLPGFTTAEIDRFFWTPLPSHQLSDTEGWAELSQDARLAVSPLSYGPFVLSSWESTSIVFEPNPFYYLSAEGLPRLDAVIFQVVEGGAKEAWERLQAGSCDVLDTTFGLENDSELIKEIQADERFEVQVQRGVSWTQLVFGIQPASSDLCYNPAVGDRPDIFGDPLTRQGLAACLDREAMLAATMDHLVGGVWPSFLPPHLTQLEPGAQLTHDTVMGLEYLDQAGWWDHDGNLQTPLQALNVPNVPAGTALSVELLISRSAFHQALGAIIRQSLSECGVAVSVSAMPAEELYAPGPQGRLFGRAFDLALISWQPLPEPDCGYYYSWQIPSAENQWIGTNVAGFSGDVYDLACADSALALPGELQEAYGEAERIFIAQLPVVPLLSAGKVMVFSSQRCPSDDILTDANFFNVIKWTADEKDCP